MEPKIDGGSRHVTKYEFYIMASSVFCAMGCTLMAAKSSREWFSGSILFCLVAIQFYCLATALRQKERKR
jgi:hypothetical protein